MTRPRDPDRLIRAFLAEGQTDLADRTYDAVRADIDRTRQRVVVGPWTEPRSNSVGRLALVAAAVVTISVVGVNLLPSSREPGAGGPALSPSPSPSPSPGPVALIGLPPEGAAPSIPERGELVVRLEGSTGGPWSRIWVFADGRLIWNRYGYHPDDASEAPTGLFEQRLTPDGVEFLRSKVISTGLFAQDLALAREGDAPFLEIQVRNGDRLVRATWAIRLNWRIGQRAPFATPEQASALEDLDALLTDPASWPSSAWQDREIKAYVPSRYWICSRGIPEPIERARARSLLPRAAQDLLDDVVRTHVEAMPSDQDCYVVTTEDARALAGILDDAGVGRNEPRGGEVWLRYTLPNLDAPRSQVWISFEPVLPLDEGVFLGPG